MVGSGAAGQLLHAGAAGMEVFYETSKNLPLFLEHGGLWRPDKKAHMAIFRTLRHVFSTFSSQVCLSNLSKLSNPRNGIKTCLPSLC